MRVLQVSLEADDAVELSELLEFVGQWLASDAEGLGASITRFGGTEEYGVVNLRDDVMRFATILGAHRHPHGATR